MIKKKSLNKGLGLLYYVYNLDYSVYTVSEHGIIGCYNGQSAERTVSSFVDSSAQHRGNEAEPDSSGNKNFQSGPNVPCLLWLL